MFDVPVRRCQTTSSGEEQMLIFSVRICLTSVLADDNDDAWDGEEKDVAKVGLSPSVL